MVKYQIINNRKVAENEKVEMKEVSKVNTRQEKLNLWLLRQKLKSRREKVVTLKMKNMRVNKNRK